VKVAYVEYITMCLYKRFFCHEQNEYPGLFCSASEFPDTKYYYQGLVFYLFKGRITYLPAFILSVPNLFFVCTCKISIFINIS